MEADLRLKAVGYWRASGARQLPRPQWLVRPGWHAAKQERITAYLRSGYTFADWLGYSFCRFGCGIDCRLMGSSDLTDGEWVWPAGLPHYIEAHAVSLPEHLIDTMRRRDWRVPELDAPPQLSSEPGSATFDFAFWLEWTRRNQRPWYALW